MKKKNSKNYSTMLEIFQNGTEASLEELLMGHIRNSVSMKTSARVVYYK